MFADHRISGLRTNPPEEALTTATRATIRDGFLRACRHQAVEHVPVWFMRQAGRSLPEYRALRESHSILDICRTPDLAVEVTLQPVRRLGVDAAILFSDIVVPLMGTGVELDIRPGVGPVIAHPIRSKRDIASLRRLEVEADVGYVLEAVRTLASELDVPLIGFGGAPFTLACYLVEGGPSKDHSRTKALMYSEPDTWAALMDALSDGVLAYLRAQVEAGASAVQLFDSWVGALDDDDHRRFVLPWNACILEGLADLGVPRIFFGVTTGELLGALADVDVEVIGIDWRVPLDAGRARVGGKVVQGNLDPAACLAPWDTLRAKALEVLERGGGRGHIFNLGHGVLPETSPDALARLVELVHAWEPPLKSGAEHDGG